MPLSLRIQEETVCAVRRDWWRCAEVEVWRVPYRDIARVLMTEPKGRHLGLLDLESRNGEGPYSFPFDVRSLPEMRNYRREIWRRAQAAHQPVRSIEPPPPRAPGPRS